MSGPAETEQLEAAALIGFLAEAADEGYGFVAFSGGEPFLYPDFPAVLEAAQALGLRRLAVTNATVLTGPRAAALPLLDLVAVSPRAAGRGLGTLLTSVGLRHLATTGVDEVILYVDGDNAPALAVYRGQGFTRKRTEVQYRGVPTP